MEDHNMETVNGGSGDTKVGIEEMTSRDYYFDSYAHFGIHEVWLRAIRKSHVIIRTRRLPLSRTG